MFAGGWVGFQQSHTARDALTGPGLCGSNPNKFAGGYQARCGYGTRLPFLVVSPWAKRNYVDHGIADQTSIIRFIEDNWSTGRIGDFSFDQLAGDITPMFDFKGAHDGVRRLLLDPTTGEITQADE